MEGSCPQYRESIHRMHRAKKRIAWVAVTASTLAILVATLHSSGASLAQGWTFTLTSGDAALAELLQNLLLFIPLGISLMLAGVPLLPAVAIGAGLSFSVEFLQQWIPGRDPSMGDIVCNTISTALGAGIVRLAPRWLLTAPHRSAWQALGTSGLAVLAWLATAALLRSAFPPPPYVILRAPVFRHRGEYQGSVLSANLDRAMLVVRAVAPARPPGRPSPLAAILDEHGTRATVLAVAGSDLSLRYHVPAQTLTLEQPDLRWRDALATIAPGDTFTAATGHDSGTVCLALNSDWRCGLGYSIGNGWRLIYDPERWPSWLLRLINACWVAGWVIGVGYWAARTTTVGNKTVRDGKGRYGTVMAKTAVALVLLGLIIVPMATELKATTLWEWIGALGGIEAGLILGNWSRNDPIDRPA
jgi:hypothetical protein